MRVSVGRHFYGEKWGCGGSMVVHQAVKPPVPGSNPASLQPAGTCQFLVGEPAGLA